MGVILDELRQILERQTREHGIVTWFDPERHYESVLDEIQIDSCRLLKFSGSYFDMRAAAEPFIRGAEPPKLLLYLPVAYEKARLPLAEILVLGTSVRPGGIGQRNAKLAVIARRALKNRVSESRLADLERQIEKGQLTLTDLENLGEEGGSEALPTALAVLFGTSSPDEAALDFLAFPAHDSEIEARNGVAEWAQALKTHFGIITNSDLSLGDLRALLTRQVFTADLLEALGDEIPQALKALVAAKQGPTRTRCADLAREWRNRRDLGSSYREAAATAEKTLHLPSIDFSDNALERVTTFASLERRLIRRIAERLTAALDKEAIRVTKGRRVGFWAEQEGGLQTEWGLVLNAAALIQRADEIEIALKRPGSWEEMVRAYIRDDPETSWSEFDSLHRRLEKRASSLEFALSQTPAELEKLVARARQRYGQSASRLSEVFLKAWQDGQFTAAGWYRQAQVFEAFVAPLLREHRTAYVLVDALRFELARELVTLLGKEFDAQVEVVIGTAPSVTEVGMAALLPRADSGLQLTAGKGLEVSIYGDKLRNRQDRIEFFHRNAGVPVIDLKLEEPKQFKRKLKDLGGAPALVVVTSREIDQTGEEGLTNAREHMEQVLTHLSLAVRKLAEAGLERLIIATDHGYIFGEELGEADKIDPPGGKTALLHRRVWVGEGGAASGSYLRTTLAKLGTNSELEIAVPWSLAGFRTPGPTAYFHGGLSPEEIILPVISLRPRGWMSTDQAKKAEWELSLGSPKITTRFLSVRITAQFRGLFEAEWPTVRIELRTNGDACSVPVSGTYGFSEATGQIALRGSESNPNVVEPNTVALMLTEKAPTTGTVSVHLVDSVSGVELRTIEKVEVSIAI